MLPRGGGAAVSGPEFAVEAGVPLARTRSGGAGRRRYPWPAMAAGDSFFLPDANPQTVENVRWAGSEFCRKHRPDLKVTIRKQDGGHRCWLVARDEAAS